MVLLGLKLMMIFLGLDKCGSARNKVDDDVGF